MLVGIHGRNDFWQGQFTETDYHVIRQAKIEMVKLMEYTRLNVLQRLRAENPSIQFIVRLYEQGQKPGAPAEFAQKHANAIESFRPYTNLFEVLNEPNHAHEGWGPTPDQAEAFNRWFLETLPLLKVRHPWAKFGFPALSPTMLPDDPHLDFDWLEKCRPAVEAADWLAVHSYWFDEHGVLHPGFGLRFTLYHQRFPNKTIHITEFNGGPQTPGWLRAQNYVKFYQEVAKHEYVASASAFIIASPDLQFQPLQWWNPGSQELYPVAWQVGQIPRPLGAADNRPAYAVEYVKHSTPAKMIANSQATVEMVIKNTSRRVWPEAGTNMVRLSYHWHNADGSPLSPELWNQHRSRLPFDVLPGQTFTVHIHLDAPRTPGKYLLKWDMVEEFVTWFAWKNVPTLDIPVEVIPERIDPPPPPPGGQIRASASHNNVQQGFDNLQQALDGNPFTRWSTTHPQRPGMWFQVDLGQEQTISQIQLTNANSPMDYPRGYVMKISRDGNNWETVDQKPQNGQQVNVVFTPRPVRFFRVEQTGFSDRWWWSIHTIQLSSQIRVSGRASHNNVLVGADNVLQALDNNPDTRWSTRTLQRPGQWFEIDLNTTRIIKRLTLDNQKSPFDYPRGYIVRLSEDQRNWIEVARNGNNSAPLDVTFTPQRARFIRIEQTGSADRWWWSIHRVGVE